MQLVWLVHWGFGLEIFQVTEQKPGTKKRREMKEMVDTHLNLSAVSEAQMGKISSTLDMTSLPFKFLEGACLGH